MITMQEWEAMSGKEKTMWFEENVPISGRGAPRVNITGRKFNDASYCTSIDLGGIKVTCPAYACWINMFSYARKINARISNEWMIFSGFRKWWIENSVDGFRLTSGIVSESSDYSKESCIFAPDAFKGFVNVLQKSRASMLGASKKGHMFKGTCSNPVTGMIEHLGCFKTPMEAHISWLNRKLEIALELKPRMDSIDPRIYPRVVEIINNAK